MPNLAIWYDKVSENKEIMNLNRKLKEIISKFNLV
jgi:hypothetical protein